MTEWEMDEALLLAVNVFRCPWAQSRPFQRLRVAFRQFRGLVPLAPRVLLCELLCIETAFIDQIRWSVECQNGAARLEDQDPV